MIKEHAGLHTGCEDEINQVGGGGGGGCGSEDTHQGTTQSLTYQPRQTDYHTQQRGLHGIS